MSLLMLGGDPITDARRVRRLTQRTGAGSVMTDNTNTNLPDILQPLSWTETTADLFGPIGW